VLDFVANDAPLLSLEPVAARAVFAAQLAGVVPVMFDHAVHVFESSFPGQAFYIGPTLYATFGERYFISAAWSIQVWGVVAGSSGALDLDNFERHHVKLRIGASF
jgi:hypothetical protein